MEHLHPSAAAPTDCPGCHRPFLVAQEVLDVSDEGLWQLAMGCANCSWLGSRELDDAGVDALDLRISRDRELIEEAADDLGLAVELAEVAAFALALREDRILPEDF